MSEKIKELAKEAKFLLVEEGGPDDKKAAANQLLDSPYSLELADYPDIVIKKKGKRSTKSLVIMPSVGTIFIRVQNLSNGEPAGEIQTVAVDEALYRTFTSGMPDIYLPSGFWTEKISSGIVFYRALVTIFSDETILEMIKKKMFPESIDVAASIQEEDQVLPFFTSAYEKYPKLYAEVKVLKKSFFLLIHESTFCGEVFRMFGLDGLRAFLQEYEKTPLWMSSKDDTYFYSTLRCRNSDILPQFPMKLRSFINYVLYDSVRMGYAGDLNEFFEEWRDSLQMEMTLYNKIRDKYPKSLPTVHKQLSYKTGIIQQTVDEKALAKRLVETSRYEGTHRGLVFMAPKSRQDFLDEAIAQANCLAGYVDKVINGDCLIMFVRKKEEPEKSYITLSVKGGRAMEAKYANNAPISGKDRLVIEQWFDRALYEKLK